MYIESVIFTIKSYRVSHNPGLPYLVTASQYIVAGVHAFPPVIILSPVSLAPWYGGLQSEQKWKQLAELATTKCQFSLAQECLHHAQDYGGLLLLATASGNTGMVGKLAEGAERDGKTNVAFLTYFLQGR